MHFKQKKTKKNPLSLAPIKELFEGPIPEIETRRFYKPRKIQVKKNPRYYFEWKGMDDYIFQCRRTERRFKINGLIKEK